MQTGTISTQNHYQSLYFQLLAQYSGKAEQYHKVAQQNMVLHQELEHLLKQKIALLQQQMSTQTSIRLIPAIPEVVSAGQSQKMQKKQKSLQRRRSLYHGRSYRCTYPDCRKVYQSSVSMNLHIKLKHNGGTKKERETLAKFLIQSEQNNEDPPSVNLNFPPNFISEFKSNYQYTKKYST